MSIKRNKHKNTGCVPFSTASTVYIPLSFIYQIINSCQQMIGLRSAHKCISLLYIPHSYIQQIINSYLWMIGLSTAHTYISLLYNLYPPLLYTVQQIINSFQQMIGLSTAHTHISLLYISLSFLYITDHKQLSVDDRVKISTQMYLSVIYPPLLYTTDHKQLSVDDRVKYSTYILGWVMFSEFEITVCGSCKM